MHAPFIIVVNTKASLYNKDIQKCSLRKGTIMNIPKSVLLEGESLHDLQLNGLQIIQKDKGFKFGMDAVLLSDFCNTHSHSLVADFGTGTGILSVLLLGKNKANHIYAFEIQSEMAEMANRSIQLNKLEDYVTIYNQDCGNAHDILGTNQLDAVITNPPYGEFGKTMRNPSQSREVSRHQEPDTLERFFKAAFRLLKGKGRLYMVYPAHSMLQVMETLKRNHLEPKRFRLVYPFIHKPANLVLIEAVKDAKPGLHTMPPLIVYQEPGLYTEELKRIYNLSK